MIPLALALPRDRHAQLKDADHKERGFHLENKTFMAEASLLRSRRKHDWDAALYAKQGHIMRLNDFLEMKRRANMMAISLGYTQHKLITRTFGKSYWSRRSKAVRKLRGVSLVDPARPHSNAVVRPNAPLALRILNVLYL